MDGGIMRGGEGINFFVECGQQGGFAFPGAAAGLPVEFFLETGIVGDGEVLRVPVGEEGDGGPVGDGPGLGIRNQQDQRPAPLHTVERALRLEIL